MADSVREKIQKNIVTTLKLINGAGSYHTDLANRVFRFGASGLDRAAYPVILVMEPSEALAWLNTGQQAVEVTMTVKVEAWANADPNGTIVGSTVLSNLVADMGLALLADPTRGGFAVETHIDSIEGGIAQETGNLAYASMSLRIKYRFRAADPTVAV